jgi:hypothetical protein
VLGTDPQAIGVAGAGSSPDQCMPGRGGGQLFGVLTGGAPPELWHCGVFGGCVCGDSGRAGLVLPAVSTAAATCALSEAEQGCTSTLEHAAAAAAGSAPRSACALQFSTSSKGGDRTVSEKVAGAFCFSCQNQHSGSQVCQLSPQPALHSGSQQLHEQDSPEHCRDASGSGWD